MPFQSEKQRRYLHANHPEIAKRWEKEYSHGGILDIDGSEEITTEEGNDISLVDESEIGVSTLFKAKDGGTPQLAKKSKDGTRPGYRGSDWGGGNPNEDRAAEESHANEFAGIDSGGWDPGVSSPGTTSTGGNVNTGGGDQEDDNAQMMRDMFKTNVTNISGGDIWDWDDTSDRDDVLDQKQDIVNRAIIFMRDKYPKSTTYAKEPTMWEELYSLSKIPTTPIGVVTAIGKDIYNTKELKDLMKEMEEAGLVGGPPGTNPTIYDEMWMHLENKKKKKDDEDTGGDGPEAPVVAPVTEEIEDSYAMAGDWLQGYKDLKAKQALSASLQEKWADERQWQQETMFANSGGLANLFRVKN